MPDAIKPAINMLNLNLDLVQTLALSIIVLYLGVLLIKKIELLNKFCIPAPVVGGVVFALLVLIGDVTGSFSIKFDPTLKNFFMIAFFTTVGFSASLSVLKKGGIAVMLFLLVSSILAVLQNVLGVTIARLFHETPFLGLLAGSISMTGGHGTAGAFGASFESHYGVVGATTVGLAAATFGLVSGSLLGGPVGRRLILKYNLKPASEVDEFEHKVPVDLDDGNILTKANLPSAFFQIAIAMGLGNIISTLLAKIIVLPPYIGAMFAAAIMRNVLSDKSKYKIHLKEVNSLGDIFLSVFLAQALMSIRLWELKSLALPLITILVAQVVLMYFYSTYVTFNAMGRDYDAAILSAGHCGFGMGATPNAVANMTVLVQKYGASPKAFFVLPIVGGLFIDLVNASIITFAPKLFYIFG